ncbi:uncharacterized protein DS421_13g397340 [Arachis hypogaea]|nr:uncharacterized protein DS421_13g397340 [Arachis hypogaea]
MRVSAGKPQADTEDGINTNTDKNGGTVSMDIDEVVPLRAKRSVIPSSHDSNKLVFVVHVSRNGTLFEERERERMIKKAYREKMTELKMK